MKARLFVSFLAVLLLGTLSLAAQLPPNVDGYTVEPGDNLWNLAGLRMGNPVLWEKIFEKNPFLREPGRRFERNGLTIVLVKPGETLVGLRELGITPTITPLSELHLQAPDPIIIRQSVIPTWFWWLLALIALALIGLWLYHRNPTQWRPMVPGGVNDAQAENRFSARADRQGMTLVPGSQERVRLYGAWGTQHRGIPIPIPHNYNGEQGWRARFRNTNGTERTGYMLKECGNDVTLGGAWYTPFPGGRVEEGWGEEGARQETPAPAPIPATTPAQPEALGAEGKVTFEFKKATADQPALIRLNGIEAESFLFSVGADGTTLRYKEVAQTS